MFCSVKKIVIATILLFILFSLSIFSEELAGSQTSIWKELVKINQKLQLIIDYNILYSKIIKYNVECYTIYLQPSMQREIKFATTTKSLSIKNDGLVPIIIGFNTPVDDTGITSHTYELLPGEGISGYIGIDKLYFIASDTCKIRIFATY